MKQGPKEADLYGLLMMLHTGGALVSATHCEPEEIDGARGAGRLFVDKDGQGYVYRPRPKLQRSP